MTQLIIAAILFVIGIGLLGGALFGRLRQRRILLVILAIVLWAGAAYIVINDSNSGEDAQQTAAIETPVVVATEVEAATEVAEVSTSTPVPTATSLPQPTATATSEPALGQLVFPSSRGGSLDIWLMDLNDIENPSQLTSAPGPDVEPVISPDGTKILFLSGRDVPANRHELWVMNIDGSEQQRLLEWPESYEWGATWSPDGEQIAFTSTRDYDYEIFIMNADGSNEPINVTANTALDTYPHWSPDGKWLVFVSDRGGNWEIWKMNIEACLEAFAEDGDTTAGCEATQLTDNLEDDFYPRWSPDGNLIAFESRRNTNRDIYIMDADGGNLTRLTRDENRVHDSNPIWALDGKAIIFSSERDFDWDIYIINIDGTGERRLTFTNGEDRFGDWTP
ncbi:MAG: hypothetical protein GY759_10450 [Chloroflexi bacterium]|nr:hypothetical protein [Chloroflexota bacterium]